MLEIRILGRFDIRSDGISVELPARKSQSLLAYLLLNIGVSHRREQVAGILWPDTDETTARSKLRYTLWQLRKSIGDQFILADKITLAFNADADYWLDSAVLENKNPERLTTDELSEVLAVYEGELLPGFYEDWVFLERERTHALFVNKIQFLLQRLIEEKRWREVLEWGERWISLDQTPEPAFRALMIAYSQLGDNAGAVSAYHRCQVTLAEQLDVEPSAETKEIFDLISKGDKPVVYTFDAVDTLPKSEEVSEKLPPFLEAPGELPEIDRSVFVTRERELAQLGEKLELSIHGQGQVVFVLGDAGQGKTALMQEFSRRTQRKNDSLVVALGSGEAHSGIGDPHLPFRDILALLSGDVEAKWTTGAITRENARRLWNLIPQSASALVEQGPDLIDTFVPGYALGVRANRYTSAQTTWLERLDNLIDIKGGRPAPVNIDHGNLQKDLFDQYTKVLQQLARQQPLLLVLDDLQWADLGSISLLFHLGRRIEGHRIMIIGAYRPDDITSRMGTEQHPLVQVQMEFKRIFGDLEVNLDKIEMGDGFKFIEAFLDTEPNRLGEEFRQALNQHTGGHPLFTIELLRQLQAQGDLQEDGEGYWIEGPHLGWDELPAKVEAVIERRVSRLPTALRDILNVASVEGQEFTAEVIAAVTEVSESKIISQLSRELDKRHLLVEASGIQRAGQQRLSLYGFRHNLFQKFIYESLDKVEQAHLHEKVGNALEELYGKHKGQVAAHLTRHFEAAGVVEKAVDYLLEAGDRAKRLSANEEAVAYLTRGLNLLEEIPQGSVRDEKELALQASLGAPLVATKGYSAPEVERTFARARELCEQTGGVQQLAPTLWGLCAFYQVRGNHTTAHEMAEQILALAKSGKDSNLRLLAYWMLGLTLTHLGKFSLARDHLDLAVDLYDNEQQCSLTYLYGQNPGVTCLTYLALNLWILGYPDQALEKCDQAISLSEGISHPFSQSFAHGMAALLHALRKVPEAALHDSEKAFRLSKKAGFPFLMALGMIIRGWARSYSGKTGMAIKLMQNGIEAMQAIGAELGRPFFLSLLAEGYGNAGQNDEGLKIISTALQTARNNNEHWNDSDLHRLMGELQEMQGGTESEIISSFHQAVEIAQMQNAKSFELRGAIALVKFGEGRDLLREAYQWFEEGHDSDLLIEASALIDQEILK